MVDCHSNQAPAPPGLPQRQMQERYAFISVLLSAGRSMQCRHCWLPAASLCCSGSCLVGSSVYKAMPNTAAHPSAGVAHQAHTLRHGSAHETRTSCCVLCWHGHAGQEVL